MGSYSVTVTLRKNRVQELSGYSTIDQFRYPLAEIINCFKKQCSLLIHEYLLFLKKIELHITYMSHGRFTDRCTNGTINDTKRLRISCKNILIALS
jgi:hypothetical protein